uniref:Uncharacterized protein n=1 Tax=Rhizophora mucronata TaxID=61149 RepID=A0A2P2JW87_RHIMU
MEISSDIHFSASSLSFAATSLLHLAFSVMLSELRNLSGRELDIDISDSLASSSDTSLQGEFLSIECPILKSTISTAFSSSFFLFLQNLGNQTGAKAPTRWWSKRFNTCLN